MSRKRGLGGLIAFSAFAGAMAGVVSYLYKYKKFSDEVDRDFTDVVDSAAEVRDSAKRSYTTLRASRTKEDIRAVAKDLGYAAKNLAIDTKNLAVDAGKDAYRIVREGLDSKFAGSFDADCVDEENTEDSDVEVEFYEEPSDNADAVEEAVAETEDAVDAETESTEEASDESKA